ncbi:GDP-mannose-dependent alpha-mannosyltransferase [Aureimonas altamirensis]|uniref:GDP-mannose-dependent alpha-mannosyltransferase n=1 Tax=Aureimonas altamirensis TaxID=370622 RepID=A0A0B1PYG9_9HYPH|nr:glycosyltransferase family 1 protein [Aureimonas altamirensis]KHJ53568.1 GDP-mannose-dependent alpha-mannosyltransferase [Aureimonas altamirensis]
MRILIITDAWHPQINGVVRVLDKTVEILRQGGDTVMVIEPSMFPTLPAPGYPEVRLALMPGRKLGRMIEEFAPDAIHIPVEGPLGLAARRYCRKRGIPFTTSFHTRFGDYIEKRIGRGVDFAYALQRRFHNGGARMMVQTATLEHQLGERGFRNMLHWGRAVDLEAFHPCRDDPSFDKDFLGLPRPIFLYLGRVSAEKNIEAFLDLDLPGSKLVVGDGPQLSSLKARYPQVHFTGYRTGEDLARHFSAADVFVFPSRFETFGLVVLESLACGTPVAALPVPGPADIVGGTPHAVLSEDLRSAALAALDIDRAGCRAFAQTFSWAECTADFRSNLVTVPDHLRALRAA